MAQASINFQTDSALKRDFERLCQDIGMNMSTAFNVYMKKAIRENRIPFELTGEPDGEITTTVPGKLLTEEELLERIRELDAGFGVEVTMEELEAMGNEPPNGPVYQAIEQRRQEMLARKREWEARRNEQNIV